MGEFRFFHLTPDDLDVVEFGRIFGQPFDDEPVAPCLESRQGGLAGVDGPLSSTITAGFVEGAPGLGP